MATPLVTRTNATTNATISQSDSKIFFKDVITDLTADDVLDILQVSGQITWQPSGTGHFVDISEEIWYGAISDAQGGRLNATKRSIEARGSITVGDVGSYAASAACYGKGSIQYDTSIAGFITDACDGLVDSSLPPLVKNVLRVWQSGQLSDASGIASYVRFSTKLLTNGFQYDKTLCQEALAKFNDFCQTTSGQTHGGEIDVGKAIMFNADATELACNC